MPDPLAEKAYSWSPYRYGFDNPVNITDPDGLCESTHTDKNGNVVAVYDDGDLGVYRHKGNTEQARAEVNKNHSKNNTSAGGEKMGGTWTSLGFADFKKYEDSNGKIVQPASGAKIDFNSSWATNQVNDILSENPTAFGYALKARGGHAWDIKTHTPNGNPYYGSKLFGKYASARDAGNFAAGAVAQKSIIPNLIIDYGFGTYNLSGNSVGKSLLMIGTDATIFNINAVFGAGIIYYKAKYGEDKLSRVGIETGKMYIKNR